MWHCEQKLKEIKAMESKKFIYRDTMLKNANKKPIVNILPTVISITNDQVPENASSGSRS
jgi:hypothetical protein